MAEELGMYLWLVSIAGILSGLLCLFSYFKLKSAPGARHYMVATLLSAVFTFSYAFELASTTLNEIKFWLGVEYLVMPFIPGFILLMCLEYAGIRMRLRFLYILFSIPIVTVFMQHTNDLHHLYYSSVNLRTDTPFPIVALQHGPFFYLHSLYLFLCLSISITTLLLLLKKSLFRFRIQIITMVTGLCVPIIANHFYLNDLSPYGIDLGPVSMSVSFILHGMALFSFQMFNVLPIAREKVFESMLEGVIVLNHNDAIVDYNRAILPIMPMLSSALIGKPIQKVLADDEKLAELILYGEESDYECVRESITEHYQVRFSPILVKNDILVGKIIAFVNITERVEMQEKLRQLASYDGLTQVYNRAFFMEQSVQVLDSLLQQGERASLLMFDIDHFKNINDTYGHETGDRVLSHVANWVKDGLRQQDVFGRYGGEEFIILCPGMDIEDAFVVAETLRSRIAKSFLRMHDEEIFVTSSFGISWVPLLPGNQEDALKRAIREADQALYAAKRNGRNNVQISREGIALV